MNRITFKPENPRFHCTTYTHSPFLWTWPGYPWYLLGIRKQRVKVGLLDLGDLDGKLLSVGILRRSLRSLRSVRSWKKNGQEGVGGFGRLEGYRPTVSGFPQLAGMLDHPASNATPATVSSFIWASLRSMQERKHIHNGCIYIQTTLSSFLPNRWSWSTTRPPNYLHISSRLHISSSKQRVLKGMIIFVKFCIPPKPIRFIHRPSSEEVCVVFMWASSSGVTERELILTLALYILTLAAFVELVLDKRREWSPLLLLLLLLLILLRCYHS